MPNNNDNIDAEDVNVISFFYENNFYQIPDFQRPFSWEKEHFEQLIDDLLSAYSRDKNDQYFLGSIILISKPNHENNANYYDIVDGQQRILSLSILSATIRDLTFEWRQNNQDVPQYTFHKIVYQQQNQAKNLPEQKRLFLRNNTKESEIYDRYIIKNGGTDDLLEAKVSEWSEPAKRIKIATDVFKNELTKRLSDKSDICFGFGSYINNNVKLVQVETSNRSTAFELFNVLNDRGMPLSAADLLKGVNLNEIEDKETRKSYARSWEGIEEDIGQDKMQRMINHIHALKLKSKPEKAIQDEFTDKIFHKYPEFKGEEFFEAIKEVTKHYRRKVEKPSIKSMDDRKNNRYATLVNIMEMYLPDEQWAAGLIKFSMKYNDPEKTYQFLRKYERILALNWLSGRSRNDRLNEIFDVIDIIERAESIKDVFNNPIFKRNNKEDINELVSGLNDRRFYFKGTYAKPKYLLLRLEFNLQDFLDKKVSYQGNITTEHILPKTVTHEYWKEKFSEEQAENWKHRLGNLTLLDQSTNSRYKNYPYTKKYEEYLNKYSDFNLTNNLIDQYDEWNIDNLKERHKFLIRNSINTWFDINNKSLEKIDLGV